MIIIYIDILLLAILLILVIVTCAYCVYRVHSLQRSGQVAILLRPTKVLFSHKKEGEVNEQLRTVVAYQNPFTGDYCVHKSRGPKGYVNSMESPATPESPASADSGVSDAYEPLRPLPHAPSAAHSGQVQEPLKAPMSPIYDNSLNKTWKWDYTEYQI